MAVLKDLIVHGSSRFLNGIYSNSMHSDLIDANSGVFKTITTTTLDAGTITTDMLKANNARVAQTLTVDGTISTNKWEAASIANIGGNFYISPTGKSDSGTITVTKTSSTTINGISVGVYTLVVGGTFGVTSTNDTIWGNNSKVIFTGSISYNNSKKFPLGSCSGTMTTKTTGTNTLTGFTITGVNSSALDIFFKEVGIASVSSTACNGYEMQISVYQSYSNSNLRPVGILLTSYGKEKKQYIDIYGGTNVLGDADSGFANPEVRIGQLDGLPNIVDGSTSTDTKPTGWGIYTTNGFFKGKIVANAGKIANFTISGSNLYSNGHDTYNKAVTGIYIGDDYISFGSGGVTYFNTSGTGKIGPWTLSTTYLRNGNITGANNTSVAGVYLGTDGLNISGGSAASTAYIYKNGSNISVNIGNKLTWNGATLVIDGAATIGGTTASTVVSNAANGASAKTAIDNLEIGGRNLLLSSANMRNNKHTSGGVEFIDDYTKITTTSKGWYDFMLSTECRELDLIKSAQSLSLSLDIKTENAGDGALYVEIITVSNNNLGSRVRTSSKTIYIPSNFPTEWIRVSGIANADYTTWTKHNDNTQIGVTAHVYWYNTGTLYIRKPKLEIGNRATDWTPAPEDTKTMGKIDTWSRSFTTALWKTYGAYGHSENWNTGSQYDNSHLKAGDTAYLTGTVTDGVGGTATIIGTVTTVDSSKVILTSTQLIFGGDSVDSASKTATDYLTFTSANGLDIKSSSYNSKVNIKSDGVRIYDQNGKERNLIDSNGVKIKDASGNVVASLATDLVIGQEANNLYNVKVDADTGVLIRKNATVLAEYGSAIKLYKPNDATNPVVNIDTNGATFTGGIVATSLTIANGTSVLMGGTNLFHQLPISYTPTSYSAYDLRLTENLKEGETYTVQFWDVNVSHTGKSAADLGIDLYWGGGTIRLQFWHGTSYFTNGHADYLVGTFTITHEQATTSGATNAWLRIYNSFPNVSGTMNMSIGKWKIEKGNFATDWSVSPKESGTSTIYQINANDIKNENASKCTLSASNDVVTVTRLDSSGVWGCYYDLPCKPNRYYSVSMKVTSGSGFQFYFGGDYGSGSVWTGMGVAYQRKINDILRATCSNTTNSTQTYIRIYIASSTQDATMSFRDLTVYEGDDLMMLDKNASDAAKVATNYIAYMNGTDGIKVASANPSSATNYVQITSNDIKLVQSTTYKTTIDSTGMKVYAGDASNPVAQFGATTIIGKTSQSHVNLDYHSLQLIDKESNTYFEVKDLRDSNGDATITTTIIADGKERFFNFSPSAKNTSYTVTITDDPSGSSIKEKMTNAVEFNTIPSAGAKITITYTTSDIAAKKFSFGPRDESIGSGGYSSTFGVSNIAQGFCSSARGAGNKATGQYSFAEGAATISSGYYSHGEGYTTQAIGIASHAEGYITIASGHFSHAEGDDTVASGDSSHAEGSETIASDSHAHAEGWHTEANGESSHAEGEYTKANGDSSHAEGFYSEATGLYSHAQGMHSHAIGNYSNASGRYIYATSQDQTVIGRNNYVISTTSNGVTTYDAGNYAFIIGNGVDGGTKTNALTVDWSGNVIGQGMAGMIQMFAGSTAPIGWLLCNGTAVSRTTYAQLFAIIGTTYGSGDGSTTFNLPDFRDNFPVGAGSTYSLNSKGGAASVTLSAAQSGLPAHSHLGASNSSYLTTTGEAITRHTVASGSGAANMVRSPGAIERKSNTASVDAASASAAHENRPPYIGINFIICTGKTS